MSAPNGPAVEFLHSPISITEEQPSTADACIAYDIPSLQATEHSISDIPFDIALPVLSGWHLRCPCGDNHVGTLGAWLNHVRYERPIGAATGTLHYRLVSILRDKND